MGSEQSILITTIHGDQLLKTAIRYTDELTYDEVQYWREPENKAKMEALLPGHCKGGGMVEVERIFEIVVIQK